MDARIALGINPLVIPDQSESLRKAMTLQALQGQSQLQGLQLEEGQRTLTQNRAMDEAARGSTSTEDYLARLAKINPAAAIKMKGELLGSQKTQGEVYEQQSKQAQGLTAGFMSVPDAQKPQAYQQFISEWKRMGLPNADKVPDQFSPDMIPHLTMIASRGLAPKDVQERADYAATGAPGSSPVVAALGGQQGQPPMPTQPQDAVDPTSGATVRALTQTQPQGVPLAENAPPPVAEMKMPVQEVNAKAPEIAPNDYRKEAKRLQALGTKAGAEQAKVFLDEANRLDDRIFKERDQTQFFSDLGITGNKSTGRFEKDGVPISSAQVQQMALDYAKAKAQNITVENYPNPITVTDPKTGQQKSIQFGKKGDYKEVPYAPASNDSERIAAGFHDRMAASEQIMGKIGPAGYPSTGQAIGESMGNVTGRLMSSAEQQKYRQAQADWVRAKLRKESGAVIGPQEMQDEIDTYFPRLGDGPDVIKQKAQARIIAQDAMRRNAGPALQSKTPGEGPPNPVPPANARQAGQVYDTPKGKLKWTGTGWVQP